MALVIARRPKGRRSKALRRPQTGDLWIDLGAYEFGPVEREQRSADSLENLRGAHVGDEFNFTARGERAHDL